MHAIVQSPELRAKIFAMAESALSSCSDNLVTGLSNMQLAVSQHQMQEDIHSRRMDQAALQQWAMQQFRLDALEQHTLKLLKGAQTSEPMETMMHAKVELKNALDLPKELPDSMVFSEFSLLDHKALRRLAQAVRKDERDIHALTTFLMNNDTWRLGMQTLHPHEFTDLKMRLDEHPFHDLPLPRTLDEEIAYAEEASQFQTHRREIEDALLCKLAGLPADSLRRDKQKMDFKSFFRTFGQLLGKP